MRALPSFSNAAPRRRAPAWSPSPGRLRRRRGCRSSRPCWRRSTSTAVRSDPARRACPRRARPPRSSRRASGRCRRDRGSRARPRANPRRPGSGRCSSRRTGSGRRRAGTIWTAGPPPRPIRRSRFHSSAISVRPSTPRNFTVCGSLRQCSRTSSRAPPRSRYPAENHFTMVTKRRRTASLQSAIVQPDSPTADDRGSIIDAAYGCLSSRTAGRSRWPRSSSVPGCPRGVLSALRIEGRAVPGDAATGGRCVGRPPGPHRR